MVGAAAADVKAELNAKRDPERAAFIARYLGVVPGGYGEGDVVLGMPVPEQRRIARRYKELPLHECVELLRSEVHEHRFVALVILRHHFERGSRRKRDEIADLYLAERAHVNNWDLIDTSAPHLLAERVRERPRALLDPLLASEVVWDRRIALLATFPLIKAGEFREATRAAERVLGDDHDLMHKAMGWMLREVGKRDVEVLRGFLAAHAAEMPRTALRYSIERLPKPERQRWMKT